MPGHGAILFVMRVRRVSLILGFIGLVAHSAVAYTAVEGTVSGVWPAGTYLVTGQTNVERGATLVVEAGAVVKFDTNQGMRVFGTIEVEGTAESPVVFTSKDDDSLGEPIPGSDGIPEPGDWMSVIVQYEGWGVDAPAPVGNFNHALLRYGGGTWSNWGNIVFEGALGRFVDSRSEWSSTQGASVFPYFGSGINVRRSTFSDNALDGVLTTGWGTFTDNSFDRNGGCGLRTFGLDAHIGSFIDNRGSGNAVNGLCMSGHVSRHDSLWSDPTGSFPFIIWGQVWVDPGVTLTITPGTVVKPIVFGIFVAGTLNAIGTRERPVVFTSIHDDTWGGDSEGDGDSVQPAPGDWSWIWIGGNGLDWAVGHFQHALLRYGGRTGQNGGHMLWYYNTARGTFFSSTCELSGSDGIEADETSPVIRKSTIRNNLGFGIDIVNGGEADLGGIEPVDWGLNEIVGNDGGQFQIANETSNVIEAHGNTFEFPPHAIDSHLLDDDENPAYGPILFDTGDRPESPGIPVASPLALMLFAVLLAAAGAFVLRSRT